MNLGEWLLASRTKVSAAEFQNNFGRYADAARDAPVVVTRYGRDELVVISAAEYERMRASYRRVIVLNDMAPAEAEELFQALANASPNPNAVALDHLMNDESERSDDDTGRV
jgi:prevent-host-death family protein